MEVLVGKREANEESMSHGLIMAESLLQDQREPLWIR